MSHRSSAIGPLVRYDRPDPSLAGYDDLLTGSST